MPSLSVNTTIGIKGRETEHAAYRGMASSGSRCDKRSILPANVAKRPGGDGHGSGTSPLGCPGCTWDIGFNVWRAGSD